jgi:deoxyribodipyrimidine photo-lyase
MSNSVPADRIRCLVEHPENPQGDFVLYWMIAARRTRFNFALEHAANRAETLGLPLLILEPLRLDYPWASERFHNFIIRGMRDNQRSLSRSSVTYYSYVEPKKGASKGLLEALSKRAALTVSDDSPTFFLAQMLRKTAQRLPGRLEVVDGNAIYPIRATTRVFTTAASFRRHLQKELPEHLAHMPRQNPLARRKLKTLKSLPASIVKRWPELELGIPQTNAVAFPIEGGVSALPGKGGPVAARRALAHFLDSSFPDYLCLRNEPAAQCQSYLSPYLHFGHISAHEIFLSVVGREDWSPGRLAERPNGSRTGWWGATEATEAFLDQLITWREIGHNMAAHEPAYQEYESLPVWAQTTLNQHASDPREYIYDADEFEAANTHDPLWNAAQTQLVREGTIHNYLRMLWGKKILEWTPHPRDALQVMIHLNNKYALDGRDPNSYSGIFWTLGRYDRAWGPERPIFGKVRYMSSKNTARKLKVSSYIEKYNGL